MNTIVNVKPEYGVNYRQGDIGFEYDDGDAIHKGISWFCRFDKLACIRVAHCFVVTGEDHCVEATRKSGVVQSDLKEKFNSETLLVFFRKPHQMTPECGERIAAEAIKQIGKKYDMGLSIGQMAPNLYLTRRLFAKNTLEDFESWWLGKVQDIDKFNCSELAAFCLDVQPEYHDIGILARPNYVVRPQQLFEDKSIFEAWKEGATNDDCRPTVGKRMQRTRAVRK